MYLVEFFYLVSILGKEWRYAYAFVVVFQLEDLMEGVEYRLDFVFFLQKGYRTFGGVELYRLFVVEHDLIVFPLNDQMISTPK